MDILNASDQSGVIYARSLGWREQNDEGDVIPAVVCLVDAHIGYNILRIGSRTYLMDWYHDRDEAIEAAVEKVRTEISEHEYRQSTRE